MKLQDLSGGCCSLSDVQLVQHITPAPFTTAFPIGFLQPEPAITAQTGSPSPVINQAEAGNRCVERNDFYTGGQSWAPVSGLRLMSGFTSISTIFSSLCFTALQRSMLLAAASPSPPPRSEGGGGSFIQRHPQYPPAFAGESNNVFVNVNI